MTNFIEKKGQIGELASKKNVSKLFRNVWLFSMLAFIVTSILWIASAWIFKLSPFSGYIALIVFSLVGLIGGVSFLLWISVLIFSKPLKLFEILMGIIVASFFAETVRQIIVIYLGNQDISENIYHLNLIVPFVLFGITIFVWMRVRKMTLKASIILLIIVTYFGGRVYAVNTHKSVDEAFTLYKEAYFSSGMAQTNTSDPKFLEVERKYVALLKEASEKPKGSLVEEQRLWSDIYKIAQEFLDYDEKLVSGQIVATADEISKKANELVKKRDLRFQEGWVDPSWVSFFFIR